ncbi:hypothetical protein L1887_26944 [Cichorium endivia]|nr:hypothetical protein L1887_26944 [Cichorium endivia]
MVGIKKCWEKRGFQKSSGDRDSNGRWYSILSTTTSSRPASIKPLKLGNMISTRIRYESTVSDFQTPDPPVEKYEYQAEVSCQQSIIASYGRSSTYGCVCKEDGVHYS